MPTVEYSLFRANFIRTHQPSLFDSELGSQDLFLLAIQEKPSAELRNGSIWHIGNVRMFSEDSGYFAVGRTTKSTIEKFDGGACDFE